MGKYRSCGSGGEYTEAGGGGGSRGDVPTSLDSYGIIIRCRDGSGGGNALVGSDSETGTIPRPYGSVSGYGLV